MKKLCKRLSCILMLAMLLSYVEPVIQAFAAPLPDVRYPSKVIYIDGDYTGKYTDNCWVPHQNHTGYTVRYEVISNKDLITVSKNGKVTATGRGVGAAAIKVTYKKANERDIIREFTVKVRRNAIDVKLTQASLKLLDAPIEIGEKLTFQAAKSYDGSYAKGHYGLDNYRAVVNDSLELYSLTPEIATAKGLTITGVSEGTAKFVVRAYQYGTGEYTAVQSMIYTIVVLGAEPTPTPVPTATPAPEVTVKQISTTQIELNTGTAHTTAPAVSSIKLDKIIYNIASSMQVRSVTVDSKDNKKLLIDTYAEMADGSKYEVTYNEKKYEFTSTDGIIASLSISPTQIEAMVGTVIYVSCIDKNGIVLGKYDMNTAYGIMDLEFTIDSGYGYLDGNKYTLYSKGDTAKATAIYHSRKYDNYGNEVGAIKTEATIVAGEAAPVTAGQHKYTIASSLPNFDTMTPNTTIQVNQQGQRIYYYIENSRGEDISYEYNLSSNNPDVLIVEPANIESRGISANLYAVSGNSTKAVVIVTRVDNNKVERTLEVTIRPESKLTVMDLSTYALSLSNAVTGSEAVTMTLKDQYGSKMQEAAPTITLLQAPNTAMKTQVEGNMYNYARVDVGKIYFSAVALNPGSYQYRVEYGGLSKVITVNVAQPNPNSPSTYQIVLSAQSVDAAVSAADVSNKVVTIRIAEYKGSVVNQYINNIKPVVKNSSGVEQVITPSASGDGWEFVVTDLNTNPVSKKAKGTYIVSVAIPGVNVPTKSIIVSDTQSNNIVAGRTNLEVYNARTWSEVLAAAFDFIYAGSTNVDNAVTSVEYVYNGAQRTDNAAYSVTSGSYAIRNVTLNVPIGSYYVPMTVAVNLTIIVR